MTLTDLPKDWVGAPPSLAVVWKGPPAAPTRDLDAGMFVAALTARALEREQARIAAFEADARERAAFNRREGIKPADFKPHRRMLGEGDDALDAGPLKGVRVALPMLKDDYYGAMHWNPTTGNLAKARATELGMSELLAGYVE